MKYLYHGTNAVRIPDILKSGIRPRGKGAGNWETHPSRAEHVYLSCAYPVFFAQACEGEGDLAVIQIEVERLNERNLYADEDALEAYNRGRDNLPGDLVARTKFYRDCWRVEPVARKWRDSLILLGNCSYHGVIPPKAISKVAIIKRDAVVSLGCDPTITLMNFKLLGPYYRWLTEAVFLGDKAPYEEGNPISDSYRTNILQHDLKRGVEVQYRPQNGWR